MEKKKRLHPPGTLLRGWGRRFMDFHVGAFFERPRANKHHASVAVALTVVCVVISNLSYVPKAFDTHL